MKTANWSIFLSLILCLSLIVGGCGHYMVEETTLPAKYDGETGQWLPGKSGPKKMVKKPRTCTAHPVACAGGIGGSLLIAAGIIAAIIATSGGKTTSTPGHAGY
ncbi:MAG: hypothetical protein ABII72_04070 [Parcubacteria group bacterium]